ncbi:Transcriptional regulatory protein AfsQ1 [Candidatus Promineifilum breve]|uniref:Transcriptional regulatory protein AfsQ1 n=1 Tax=Candidatus Promineifilum breve TaxID=1806508 RepID=A0A160T7B8_9CHLR|nr:response regulator transcription factor [Candidatus Promineifilum breve]CUS05974.1 Transcriptional regulatory protein AfsQ1 [Candidatus Promineifilum breve]
MMDMARHILIVDDDALMRRSVSLHLEQNGYRAGTAATAEDALALARRDRPDLILLDIGLPGMDGLQAIRHFQRDMDDVPVIFVTARRRELDTILGLEMGADDYITKPFNLDILLAHVKAILRRAERGATGQPPPDALIVGDLHIDPAAHEVTIDGRPIALTAKEFAVLHTLALDAGKVVSTEDILSRVWGAEFMGEPQVVYVNIRWLREKIETDPNQPRRIINVRGVGYKLIPNTPPG